MQLLTFEIALTGQRTTTVKAYGIDYHRTHTEFKDYYGKTVVAYRAEDVLKVTKVSV